MAKIKQRGGGDLECIYFEDAEFKMPDGTQVVVRKTKIPGIDMDNARARHLARYSLAAFFCRPGHKVLDFPCGSGYAAALLKPFGVNYTGLDIDAINIEYAQCLYGGPRVRFDIGDLRKPDLPPDTFD